MIIHNGQHRMHINSYTYTLGMHQVKQIMKIESRNEANFVIIRGTDGCHNGIL